MLILTGKYLQPMPQRSQLYRRSQSSKQPFGGRLSTTEEQKFYQSYKWIKFRAKHKRTQRLKDEPIAHKLYKESKDIPFTDYAAWLASGKPLCVHYLKEGKIIEADVLDHETRIREGGGKFDTNNLQWLSHHKHNVKSGKEAHAK